MRHARFSFALGASRCFRGFGEPRFTELLKYALIRPSSTPLLSLVVLVSPDDLWKRESVGDSDRGGIVNFIPFFCVEFLRYH